MSKNFEKEYKEYLNAQAPDLWDRIEAGVDALELAAGAAQNDGAGEKENVVPISSKKSKKEQKKRRVRYQHYRMIASVAACLFALVIIVPVYLLTQSNQKSESASDAMPQKIENVTIENLVVDASESEPAAEEAAPMEEVSDGTTEIVIPEEENMETHVLFAEGTEQKETGAEEPEATDSAGGSESGAQVANQEMAPEEGSISDMLQTDDGMQKEMTVTILGEGSVAEDGVTYRAVENGSESSKTVTLFVPEGKEIVLTADGVYVVGVRISEDGAYYIVESATMP